MADDIIKIRIEADMDFGDAQEQLKAAGKEIRGMKEEMADMPNVSRIFNNSIEKTASIVDSVSGKLDALTAGRVTDSDKKESFINRANEAIKDANVMHGLQVGSSTYGVQIAREWFKGLPQAVQKEFDAITPTITAIIRSRMSSISRDGLHFKGASPEALAVEALDDKKIKGLIDRNVKLADQKQVEGYIKRLIPNIVAQNRLNEYQEARYGSVFKDTKDAMLRNKPHTYLPESYRSSFLDAQAYRRNTFSEKDANKVLSQEAFATLQTAFEKHPIAVKAAIASGISRRDNRGILETRRDLTREDWENMREALYLEMENRATGAGSKRINIYGADDKSQSTLAKRFTSTSAGKAVLAMFATEAMMSPEAWVDKTAEAGYVKQAREAKRILDSYSVLKYNPFLQQRGGSFNGNPFDVSNAQFAMIQESQNTQLLGKGKWRHNQDISDTVALISFAGYDPENKEQFNFVKDLFANGKTINGVPMVAQSTHGNGNDTVVRMIAKTAYDAVTKEEGDWARQHGFSGNYFQNFTDKQIAEMAAADAKFGTKNLTTKILGKKYDAENKGWSPSAEMGLNLNGKKFAIVDVDKEGDGSAWLASSVMPYANQSRFAVAGKGSTFVFKGNTMGDYAKRAGFLDDQGRWMMKGLNGEMFDVSGYNGVIPADVIKNTLAYGHVDPETGKFVYGKSYINDKGQRIIDTSNEALSEMVTSAIQRYGFRAIADYENENQHSNNIGSQMTSFMKLSPEMRENQANAYAKVMRELDTEEGMLRYVFTNQDTDWVSKQVHLNPQLLHTATARKRVDDFRASLQQDMASGQYIDLGQDDSLISQARLADNLLRVGLETTQDPQVRANVLEKAKSAMLKAHNREYTDEEILDLINLNKNAEGEHRVIDFQHMNEKHVGLLRSPTGYGNMAYAENIAAEIAPLFDAFGQEKTGAFVSKEVLDILQSADYDGDRVKIVTGYLADAVKKTEAEVRERKKLFANLQTDVVTNEAQYQEALTDDAAQRAHAAGRNVQEPIHMGFASAGIRGMQIDTSNPLNNPYLAAQDYYQKMYDITSVGHKDPQIVDMTKIPQNVWDVNKLGREFTKFTENAQSIFQYDPDQLDELGNVLEKGPDIFQTATGKLVNMRRVRDLQVDQTNLPSTHMDAHMMGLGATRRTFLEGSSDIATWNAIAEALEHLEMPKNATQNTKDLLSMMRQMHPQFGSGERGIITEQEASDIRTKIALVKKDIDKEAAEAKRLGGIYEQIGEDGKLKTYKTEQAFIEAKEKEYGVLTARNAVDVFGVTESRVARKHGQTTANALGINGTIEMMDQVIEEGTLKHAEETVEQAAEQVKQEIAETKATSKSKKPRAKRTPKPKEKTIDPEIDKRIAEQIQNIQEDPSKTIQETYGKLLSDFAGIEATKALAMKMYEDNNRTIQGQRKVIGANRDLTEAEQFFRVESGKRQRAHEAYQFLMNQGNQQALEQKAIELGINPGSGTQLIKNALAQQVDMIDRGFIGETRQWATNKTQQSLDYITQSVEGTNHFQAEAKQIESWTEAIRQAQSALDEFLQSRDQISKEGAFSEEDIKKDTEAQDKMLKNIQDAAVKQAKGIQQIQQKNSDYFADMTSGLYDRMYGRTASPLEKVDLTVAGYKESIANGLTRLEQAHKAGPNVITEEAYLRELENFRNLEKYAEGSLRSDMYDRIFSDYNRRTSRMELQSDRMTRQRMFRLSHSGVSRFAAQNENEYQQREILQDQMQSQLDQLIQARDGRLNRETGERTGGITDPQAYARATEEINKLSAAMANNQKQMDGLKGPSGALNATFSSIGMSVQRLAMRFGRQLFQKALVEAKKFVIDYNRTMTEIQMITLKTDDQMSGLGDSLISKAKEMKISVSEISKSAATLYRQGLSDEEVNERLEIISKFSKVSGTKIDAATKLITVAMNTGLVTNPEVASDVVTALGDSAATNAAEIERGIEKAGAAAAADGTTFGQLAAMLTAITSTTQIGGSVAGRTLNTIFGRMNKIGTNELIYDENGNAVSGSAVAKLLEKQGISQYDNGVKKSSYDTLYELSQKWDKMSDAEQQQIATAIAGTRQYSNFSAVMQGMAEGKVDRYMKLVGESSGITDKKFEIYTKSLDAAFTDLKNTYDEFVKDFTSNGLLPGALDVLGSIIAGVDNLTKSLGPLGTALSSVLPLLFGLTLMRSGIASGNLKAGLIGVGIAAAGGIVASLAGGKNPTASEKVAESSKQYDKLYEARQSSFDRYEELKNNTNKTAEENNEFYSLSKDLAVQFGLIDSSTASTISSMEELTAAIKGLGETSGETGDAIEQAKEERDKSAWAQNINKNISSVASALREDFVQIDKDQKKLTDVSNDMFVGQGLWNYDAEQGKYVLGKDAGAKQNDLVMSSMFKSRLFGLPAVKYDWNQDIKPILPHLYANASEKGYIRNQDGSALTADQTTYEYWLNRLEHGNVHESDMQGMLDYYNEINTKAGYSAKDAVTDSVKKDLKSRLKDDLKVDQYLSETQVDQLAEIGAKYHMSSENPKRNTASTLMYLFGNGTTQEEILGHVNGLLESKGYQESSAIQKMPFDLEDVGTDGYYVDETGKKWTKAEVLAYSKSQESARRNNAISIMRQHNMDVQAEYDSALKTKAQNLYGSSSASRKYYESLWREKNSQWYSPDTLEAIWDNMDENLRNRALSDVAWYNPFDNLGEEEKSKYLTEATNEWDKLKKETQNEWIEKAKGFVSEPENLIGGVNATVTELGKLYDSGEALTEVADKINDGNKKLEEGQHKFEARVNHFLESASDAYSSDKGFEQKNLGAISADNLTSLLLSGQFGTGAQGVAAFMDYINSNTRAGLDWNNLLQSNLNLSNLMQQVERNTKTGEITAPEDFMEQLLQVIQSESLTYGEAYLTSAERGAIAQRAYNGLRNGWFISQQQKDAAQEEAWIKYQEEVLNPYNAEVQRLSSAGMSDVEREREFSILSHKYGNVYQTKEAFVGNSSELTAGAMSGLQSTYLRSVLGDRMYSRVLESLSKGGRPLSKEEQDFADLVLGNAAKGLPSLTAAQQLNGIKQVTSSIKNGSFARNAAYDQYMSQFSDWDEYAALLQLRQQRMLSPEENQRMGVLEMALSNFERDYGIKVEVEGIKQLEEAGEVAEGTASKIEKLRKGGKVKVDVEMQIHNEAFESGQTRERLYRGTATEQDEVAMAYLGGMSREEYYSDREGNLAKAFQVDREVNQPLDANTWKELYKAQKTIEGRQIILDAAAKAGFVASRDSRNQVFEYVGTDLTNVNPLTGTAKIYSDAEKNAMLDDILAGRARESGEGGNADLYDAAIEAAGENTRELLRRRNENILAGRERDEGIENSLLIAAAQERTAYRNSMLSDYSSRLYQAQQAQWGLNNPVSADSAGYIASFLPGMNEKDVQKMLSTTEGKAELSAQMKESQKALYSEMAKNIADVELNPEDVSGWKDQIQNAADKASGYVKEFLQWMADSITEGGEAVEGAGYQTFSEVVSNLQNNDEKRKKALDKINGFIQSENYEGILQDNKADYNSVSSSLIYMLNDRAVNGKASVFSTEMINNAYQNELFDRESAPQTQQAILSHLFGNDLSSENMVSTYQEWMQDPTKYAAQLSAFNGLEGIGDVKEAVSSETNAINKTTEAMKKYNQEMGVKALQYARAFGDQTDDVTASLLNLAKGGKTAAKEIVSLSRKAFDTQDTMTAWTEAFNGGKVKSGKQVSKNARKAIADFFDISENEVAKWSANEMAKYFANDNVKGSIQQQITDVVNTAWNDALADIQANQESLQLSGEPITYKQAVDYIFETSDPAEQFARLQEVTQGIQSDAVDLLGSLAQGNLVEWIAKLNTAGTGDSFRAWITATANTNAKRTSGGGYGYNNRGGGGGGGGGKSKTDKLIEETENRVMEAKHKITMAEAKQEHFAFTNQYQNEINAIYEEISAQKGLAEVYQENLVSLKAQQDAVKKYSEDWWKLEKQILSTQEALADVNNTIEALSKKQVEVVQRKQENEDAPYRQKRNMIDSYVERFQTQYQSGGRYTEDKAYKAWEKYRLNQVNSIQQEIDQNKKQMAEWQALLGTLDKNTQTYKDVQQKIWDIQKENAELENELLQQEIDLNNARLERIAKVLQNNMGGAEHEINMSDTRSQIYQITRDYAAYRTELAKQKSQYGNEATYYATALEQAKQQMNSLVQGSAAWYQARDAVYQYEEALQQLELTQEELDQALRESYLTELYEKIDKVDTKNQQRLTAAQNISQRAKLVGDDEAYISGLEKEEKALIKQTETEQKNLALLMELKNSGKIKKGTKEWDELLQKIKDVENQMNQTANSVLEKASEIAQVRLEKIMGDYEDNIRDVEHMFNMIQYQETHYKNNGELTNYGEALKAERENRQELLLQQRATRTQLLQELNRYEVGTQQYENVLEQIQKIEEEIAKTENAVDSVSKAIKENEEAIRKVKMSIENMLNNEMKKRVQQQKEELSAAVSLQKTILDTIKKRYQDEWRLIKQDLEKKKRALQEEKSLIQERVRARKDAEQTEDKQDQLTELQKQLAIIEADPTRTKEAKELRKEIEDLQKEISDNLADNIANAEQKRLDDIINGITDYVTNHEQDLNEYLQDNTNFQEILDRVLSGAEEDYADYMRENDETYKNATVEQKQLMEQGWHETWLKMRGDVENYWNEVLRYTEINEENQAEIRDEFINYMKQGSDYQNASETRQMSFVYEWTKAFDDYIASMRIDENAGRPETTDTGEGGSNPATGKEIKDLLEDLKNSTLKTSIDGPVALNENYMAALSAIANSITGTNRYIKGGIVDYTGLARVDGTLSKPEAFLNAVDTANVRSLVDELRYTRTRPFISQVPEGSFVHNETSVGDVYVTINEAEINSDQDIDELARRVGQSFTRQLSHNGFNTANYAF